MKYHNIIKFEFHQIINSFFQQFSCTQTFEGQSLTFNYQKKKKGEEKWPTTNSKMVNLV